MDLPLRRDLAVTESVFDAILKKPISASLLNKFIEEYFGDPRGDLVFSEPPDFVAEPEGFLPRVEHPVVRAWALEVHSLWRNLSRRVAKDVKDWPERRTLLPLPDAVVIPGSRFQEVYYWDSYWIIR